LLSPVIDYGFYRSVNIFGAEKQRLEVKDYNKHYVHRPFQVYIGKGAFNHDVDSILSERGNRLTPLRVDSPPGFSTGGTRSGARPPVR
jgi:hypothetical protein